MSTRLHVTLSEVVDIASHPLSESTLWGLLQLSTIACRNGNGSGTESKPELLITPESLLLYPGGRVDILHGMYDDIQSQFKPPELNDDDVTDVDVEKMYVYALGATLYAILERSLVMSSDLHQLLDAMRAVEPSQRPSLDVVLSTCEKHTLNPSDDVNHLVTMVIDTSHDTTSEDFSDTNLDSELMDVMCSSQKSIAEESQKSSYSARPLERSTSVRSVGGSSLARLSVSSMPAAYHSSLHEGLDRSSQQSVHNALSLCLQSYDIHMLASKARMQSRKLPSDPVQERNKNDLRRTASLSAAYTRMETSNIPSSLPPSPPVSPPPPTTPSLPSSSPSNHKKEIMIWPEDTSLPLVNAFQLDDFPSMPPPPVPVTLSESHDDSDMHDNTGAALNKIDSILKITPKPSENDGHVSTASFDYSDMESSCLNKPLNTSLSEEEEFGFPPSVSPNTSAEACVNQEDSEAKVMDTHTALDDALQQLDAEDDYDDPSVLYSRVNMRKKKEDRELRALYATVDISKKTKRSGRADWLQDTSERIEPSAKIEEHNNIEERPPVPPPMLSDSDISSVENRFSGVYEDVEARYIQTVVSDSNGYTEVVGSNRAGPAYELGYSGTGSLEKLRNVLGPAFSTMSGEKVMSDSLPKDRRIVEVILLNGKAVEFAVSVTAKTCQLLDQVMSYQSLQETHLFGLTIRNDRDDIFLDVESKLIKHAPTGWSSSTPFTVFFQVKFYVENISQLKHSITRHLYYLQLRKDLMEGKMFCHEDHALHLAALAVQAEKGNIVRKAHHIKVEDYLPSRIVEKLGKEYLASLLSSMHMERYGLSRTEAELEFLKEAQKLPEYGMLFYRVSNTKHGEIGSMWLGFCVRGVVVFDVHRDAKTAIQHCAWRKTTNISYAHRKFIIELQDNSEPLVFYTNSYKRAKYLLELSKACHKFQLVWATRKTHNIQQISSSHISEQDTSVNTAEAIVEYPSSSRPCSLVVDNTTTSITTDSCPVTMETVRIVLNKGDAYSFGFSIAGSSHCDDVYVVKVESGGISYCEGLLIGDRIVSVNEHSVSSYKQTHTLLRNCGSQLVMEVKRKVSMNAILPPGESMIVDVWKEAGVIGVRIAGGSDKPYGRGLVRIKQVTANTEGSRSGSLREGDIILKINSQSLCGMTHRQAADVILHAEDHIKLYLHRPKNPQWWKDSSDQSLSVPQTTSSLLSQAIDQPSSTQAEVYKDNMLEEGDHRSESSKLVANEEIFDVILKKGECGFGFRLDKSKSNRDSCGVFILAIDEDPARSCDLLKEGDEIISVNEVSLLNQTHQECLQALRTVSGSKTTLTIRRHNDDDDLPPLPTDPPPEQ